ncbi:type II secretion system F family protein [Microbacterium sediminis]|uniref:Type II secretion protein F n=1 Tax=Microbacterium sediminis TaxID=904291 RepID=A0A1B9NFM0_9MICO|nr:type II secretion system F family protein [Microbacterium sediminis]OCG75421.1 type II secretion protein F [Microbacterium sediminis]QBR74372.1 type II secretion system F family protein [Microbacterium sediminis]
MTVLTDAALAILLGGSFGAGVWTLLALVPRWGAVPLGRRIAPYIRDVTDPEGTTLHDGAIDPGSALAGGARAAWLRLRVAVTRVLGGGDSVARRLQRAGLEPDVAAFRGRQLAWALGAAAAGGALTVALAVTGRFTGAAALLPVVTGAAGALGCDALLTARARGRSARIAEELPTVLEFLALCLAAGEGILDSVRRVSAVGGGELTLELRRVVVEVATGASLGEALSALARRVDVPAVGRAIDHLVAAIDRGAPLAQTLEAQAADAREEAKRTLIEQAGRREIGMLIPLVFGLLPLSVIFAVFPGIVMLRIGL